MVRVPNLLGLDRGAQTGNRRLLYANLPPFHGIATERGRFMKYAISFNFVVEAASDLSEDELREAALTQMERILENDSHVADITMEVFDTMEDNEEE